MKAGNLWEDFEWRRAEDGYEWREIKGGLLLVPKQNDDKPLRTVPYRPLSKEHAGLLGAFAALEPSAEAVLKFANCYGQLGYPVLTHVWGEEPIALLPPLEPWDASPFARSSDVRKSYPGLVGEFLALPENPDWERRSTWAAQVRLLSQYRKLHRILKDVPDIAESLQSTVNMALQETLGPFLSWSIRDRRFQLRFWPSSLVGAIWLQAALALARPLEIHKCPICKSPIEISRSGGARTDAVFCSTKCKSQDYRQRKRKAALLAGNGWTLARIARRLRSDARTVRKWLQ